MPMLLTRSSPSISVPILVSSNLRMGRIERAFGRCPHVCPRRTGSLQNWLAKAQALGVGVIGLDTASVPETLRSLQGLLDDAWGPRLLCVAGDGSRLRTWTDVLNRIGLESTVLMRDAQLLRYQLGLALIHRTAARLNDQMSRVPHLSLELRDLLRVILAARIPAPGVLDAPPVRFMVQMARDASISRTTVWKRAKDAGVRIPAMSRLWLATQAAVHLAVEAPSLEELAWRAGYKGHSGLGRMLLRVTGTSAPACRQRSPQETLARCEARWSALLYSGRRGGSLVRDSCTRRA